MAAGREQDIQVLEAQADQAVEAGREADAAAFWGRILEIDPRHERSLSALGQLAFRGGDMEAAKVAFERLTQVSGKDVLQWVNLAVVYRNLGDEAAEEETIRRALGVDAMDLMALLMRGNLYDRQNKRHQAARAYGAAATIAPPPERLHAALRPLVAQAAAYRDKYDAEFATFLDQGLQPQYAELDGSELKRFRDSVDIMVGRKRRYDSRSARYHFPELPAIEFFDRAQFPWLDAVEAATGVIREEFLEVLRGEDGFTPYIQYPPDEPQNQWVELNNSPRWSAFHLIEMSSLVQANAARCPQTMKILAGVPQPEMKGRTPSAMFSLLKPKTRIPAHTGVTNARLVTHLPLIIPGGCGFRVGNDTREWIPGNAWVFDDTIEHEAWNESDKPRVVLIFDIWHPHLTAAERRMITALSSAMEAFVGDAGGFEL
ncbi:MAG: aspartyl/asparaginyl beta-hydroxylase domain-containing protein [Usitatibacter sp.]